MFFILRHLVLLFIAYCDENLEDFSQLIGSKTIDGVEVLNSELPLVQGPGDTCLKIVFSQRVIIDHFTLSIVGGSSADVSFDYIVKGETFEGSPGTFEEDKETGVLKTAVSVLANFLIFKRFALIFRGQCKTLK